MTRPTVHDILQTRDVFRDWLDDAIAAVFDIPDAVDLKAARLHAANKLAKADEILGCLCRMLARYSDIPAEDAPTLEGLEMELKQRADHDPDLVDKWMEDADFRRALRKVAG